MKSVKSDYLHRVILILVFIRCTVSFPRSESLNKLRPLPENAQNDVMQSKHCKNSIELVNENSKSSNNYLENYTENMKKYMNATVDPCEDFYQYACGNWEQYNKRAKEFSKLTSFKIIEQDIVRKVRDLLEDTDTFTSTDIDIDEAKAKIYYKSCLERGGIGPLLEFFDGEFGGWPILTEDWSAIDVDWLNLTKTGNIFSSILISTYATVDMKDISRNAIYIDEPRLGLINSKYYLDASKSEKVEAYKTLISDCLQILGVSQNLSEQAAVEIIDLERSMAAAMRDPDRRLTDDDQYHETTIEALMLNHSLVDWKRLIELELNRSIEIDQRVVVCNPDYLGPFSEIISNTDTTTITNYICWRIALHLLPDLDERFEDVFTKYRQRLYGTSENLPHWMECVRETMMVTERAISSMFVRKYFNETSRETLTELMELLKYSFLEIIKDSDWLDDETKEYALKKLNYTRLEVGYPDWLLDQNITDFYAEYNFLPDTYFDNYFQFRKSDQSSLDKLLSLHLIDAWQIINPISVDAYHVKVTNQIIFPAGILQPPMYHPDFPEAIKFGVIGSYIGHELTHGFDDVGRKYDHVGRMKDWWTKNSTEAFVEKAQCYIAQYNNYTVQGNNVNGEISLGENIADNGGLTQSYRAYKNWLLQHDECDEATNALDIDLTGSQLFFLAYAQSWCYSITPEALEVALTDDKHTPENIRMVGAVRNVPDFAEVYNCPLGSFMNPLDRCKLW